MSAEPKVVVAFNKGTPDGRIAVQRELELIQSACQQSAESMVIEWHVDPANLGILSRFVREDLLSSKHSMRVILASIDIDEHQTDVIHEGALVPTLRRLSAADNQGKIQLFLSSGRRYVLPPPALDVSTNDLCGLKCIMCGNRATQRDPARISVEQVRELLSEAVSWGIERVALTGAGEPFRDPDMLGHIRFANERGLLITITSNGFPISEKLAHELASSWVSVSISIHGATEKTHDEIVGVPTAGEHAWRAIERMAKARRAVGATSKLSINVSTVIQRGNVHEIADLVRRAHSLGADGVNIQPINLQHGSFRGEEIVRRDDLLRAHLLPSKEQQSQLDKLFEELSSLRQTLGKFVHADESRIALMRRYFDDSSKSSLGVTCRVGDHFLAVDHRGNLKPCYRLPWTLGDARVRGVRKVWNSVAYQAIREQVLACPLTCLNNCFFRETNASNVRHHTRLPQAS